MRKKVAETGFTYMVKENGGEIWMEVDLAMSMFQLDGGSFAETR
ncbi:MAG: hypothetical protein ACK4HQ_02865 [Brevinematales bacterium]